jgi:deoxyribodipyrimidine photo-lyase
MLKARDKSRALQKQDVSAEKPPLEFESSTHDSLAREVKELAPWFSEADYTPSPHRGGKRAAEERLAEIKPESYGVNRNHLEGDVTRLSPYISRGVISLTDVRDKAVASGCSRNIEKFVQQLAWREYWQGVLSHNPDWIWEDAEDYKTGYSADFYQDELPKDIQNAQTGVAAIDHFLRQLLREGWIHNHARLYVAGYICHWRHVKWQAGARFFLNQLLDADPASNNLSWQWVASTFSHKPYFFNLENIQKFSGDDVDTRPETNVPIDASYDTLHNRLFPNLDPRKPS